jgi:hypothetical protein
MALTGYSGIQTMDAWIETFGTGPAGSKALTTSAQSLVVSILSAGVRIPKG